MTPVRRSLLALASAAAVGAGATAGVVAVVATKPHSTTTTVTTTAAGSPASSASQIYSRVKQGVVEITTGSGEGTGFVLSKSGDIVTNEHVVAGANTVKVVFADGGTATGKVVGADASSDVAVVHVGSTSEKLSPLTFADSDHVQVGDPVLAIGSPFGLQGTLTSGVVSALNRTISSPSNYSISGALQTDAAINPGNSGGPLLDAAGHVVGMNAQIESSSNANNGVGFAISSNTVQRIAEQLAAGHTPRHAYRGVALDDAAGGAKIAAVSSGGPAARAGLKSGDVIVAIDGTSIANGDAAVAAINAASPGDHLKITVERGGKRTTVDATLATQPATTQS